MGQELVLMNYELPKGMNVSPVEVGIGMLSDSIGCGDQEAKGLRESVFEAYWSGRSYSDVLGMFSEYGSEVIGREWDRCYYIHKRSGITKRDRDSRQRLWSLVMGVSDGYILTQKECMVYASGWVMDRGIDLKLRLESMKVLKDLGNYGRVDGSGVVEVVVRRESPVSVDVEDNYINFEDIKVNKE